MSTPSASIAKSGGLIPRMHLALLGVLTLAATAWGWMLMDGQQGRQGQRLPRELLSQDISKNEDVQLDLIVARVSDLRGRPCIL